MLIINFRKLMKKVFILSLVFAMCFSMVASVALADTTVNVVTNLTKSTGGGATPVVKAKWEMRSNRAVTADGLDDGDIGHQAQFLPSGDVAYNTGIEICAVANDPDGLGDIQAVYADMFYPGVEESPVHPTWGCGEQWGDELELTQLDKQAGIDLFCGLVKTNDVDLPVFYESYNWDEICNTNTGELYKNTAFVYCGTRDLSYEAPAGLYEVKVHAVDTAGIDSEERVNQFNYIGAVGFETDFTSVAYGSVKLNTEKIVSGDLNMSTPAQPTVTSVGNVRINMKVMQDDMAFGTTGGVYNVGYKARVGSAAADTSYAPFAEATLARTLELSETEEMDFGILVTKFPNNGPYQGIMTLSAAEVAFVSC